MELFAASWCSCSGKQHLVQLIAVEPASACGLRGPGSTAANGVNHEAKLSGSHRFSNSSTEMLFHITHTNTFFSRYCDPLQILKVCNYIYIWCVLYSSGQQNVAMYSYLILKIVCIYRCSHVYIIVWQYSRVITYIFHWHKVLYLYSLYTVTLLQYVWACCQATLTAACLLNSLACQTGGRWCCHRYLWLYTNYVTY